MVIAVCWCLLLLLLVSAAVLYFDKHTIMWCARFDDCMSRCIRCLRIFSLPNTGQALTHRTHNHQETRARKKKREEQIQKKNNKILYIVLAVKSVVSLHAIDLIFSSSFIWFTLLFLHAVVVYCVTERQNCSS